MSPYHQITRWSRRRHSQQFMTHKPKIPSQNGVQKPISAIILQLLILFTLISTSWWQKIVSYILLVKNLCHFGIVADSLILENLTLELSVLLPCEPLRLVISKLKPWCYFFLFRNKKPGLFSSQKSNHWKTELLYSQEISISNLAFCTGKPN